MTLLPALPIVLPMAAFAVGLLAHRQARVQTWIALAVGVALPAVGGALLAATAGGAVPVLEMGGWSSPLGIALVVDRLAAVMVLVTGIVALACTVYLLGEISERARSRWMFPMLHLLLAGVGGAFVTGDLFNLYVWFEVMLIASFVLLGLGRGRASVAGTVTYVVLNLIASTVFLAAAGLLYAGARTLHLAELSRRLPELAAADPTLLPVIAGLLFVAFGIKSGLFPLFFWLPPAYPTLPVGVSALFAGLLTKVGVYAILRLGSIGFAEVPYASETLLAVAGATMLAGVFGAVSRMRVRSILSFHIISQIGYIVVGAGLLTESDPAIRRAALGAAIFYTLHHILVKTNLFLASGLILRLRGTEALERRGGLAETSPWLAILFVIPAASLAGLPPLSGFWAKLAVIDVSLAADRFVIVAVALAAGLLTLASMVKIWTKAFWGEAPDELPRDPSEAGPLRWMPAPMALLALLTLAIGLLPGPLAEFALGTAAQLLDGNAYRTALGVGP